MTHLHGTIRTLKTNTLSSRQKRLLVTAFSIQIITERLEDGVGLQNLLLHPGVDVAGDRAEVLQDELGGLGLPSSALARYHAGLVADGVLERLVSRLRQGEHVRLQSAHLLPVVSIHVLLRKDEGAGLLGRPIVKRSFRSLTR